VGLGQIARASPDKGLVQAEFASLANLAVVDGRDEILAGLAVRRKVFNATGAEMVRAEMKVAGLGIVVDSGTFRHIVELVGSDFILLLGARKKARLHPRRDHRRESKSSSGCDPRRRGQPAPFEGLSW